MTLQWDTATLPWPTRPSYRPLELGQRPFFHGKGCLGQVHRGSAQISHPACALPCAKVPINQLIFQKSSSLCACAGQLFPSAIMATDSSGGFFKRQRKMLFPHTNSNETLAQDVPKQCQASKSSGAKLVITL